MTLLMFLMSKDDNLLLLTGGLLFTIFNNGHCLTEDDRRLAPELFSTADQSEEEHKDANPYLMMATADGVLNSCIEVFNTDMPLRNFTLRLFTRMLLRLRPELVLTPHQKNTLVEALRKHSKTIKKLVMVSAPTQGIKVYDPEYRLYESFMQHLTEFNPPESALQVEFTRSLAHPLLLLRVQTEKLTPRITA